MPNRPAPISDLARMYRERIPAAPKSIGRLGPVSIGGGGLSLNPMPAIKSTLRFLRNQPGTQVSTPINVGGGVVSMGGQGSASQLMFDPAAQAVERAVGDFTAIPGVGKPSPSYTAEQIRQQGVVPGVLGAAMDYSMFVPGVTKPGRVALGADAYEKALAKQIMKSADNEIAKRTSTAIQVPVGETGVLREKLYEDLYQRGYNAGNYPSPVEELNAYTTNKYTDINNLLRSGTIPGASATRLQDYAKTIANIDRLIATSPAVGSPMTVYRGMKLSSRGGPFVDEINNLIANPVPGTTLSPYPGFMSTTLDPDVARLFGNPERGANNVLFEIVVPKGSRGIVVDPFTYNPMVSGPTPDWAWRKLEDEVILPRNTKLKFVGQQGDRLLFEAIPGPIHAQPFPYTPGRAQADFDARMNVLMNQEKFNLQNALADGGPQVA